MFTQSTKEEEKLLETKQEIIQSSIIPIIKESSLKLLTRALEQNYDLNSRDDNGDTALCVLMNNCGALTEDHPIYPHDTDFLDFITELQRKSRYDKMKTFFDIASAFITKGVDPNDKNKSGTTTLINAVLLHNPKWVFGLLIYLGAKLDEQDNFGNTALMLAVQRFNNDLHNNKGNDFTYCKYLLNLLLNESYISKLKKLSPKTLANVTSSNPNIQNNEGDTALIFAVRSGNMTATKALLDAGANPDIKNKKNESAFSLAECMNLKEIRRLLNTSCRIYNPWSDAVPFSGKGLFSVKDAALGKEVAKESSIVCAP